jgi:hypothetical protein
MTDKNRVGILFATALVLSWIFVTTNVALVVWAEHGGPISRALTWLSLWTFTVVVPTLNAMTIHRAIGRIGQDTPGLERTVDELARLRPFVLLSANMALLSACALIFGR